MLILSDVDLAINLLKGQENRSVSEIHWPAGKAARQHVCEFGHGGEMLEWPSL
jgi:hypothetical protein